MTSSDDIRRLFDRVAPQYDDYTAHPVARQLERLLIESVQHHLPAAARLVDIGCGPGLHALALARLGYAMTAVDLSASMIETVRARAEVEGLQIEAAQLDVARDEIPGGPFDGAFALMGPLNYVPDPGPILARIRAVLKPRALLWLGLARGAHLPRALLRARTLFGPIVARRAIRERVSVAGEPLDLFLWDPEVFRSELNPSFDTLDYVAVGVVPRLTGRLDAFLGAQPFLRRLGGISFICARAR